MNHPLLSVLAVQHPEWRPVVAGIDEAVREGARPSWARAVPAIRYNGRGGRPLLHGAVIELTSGEVARWIVRILDVKASAGDATPVALSRAVAAELIDPLLVMEVAVTQDPQQVAELARALDTDPMVLATHMPLIARPLLQACRRAWARRVPHDWSAGYCPICGDCPVLAEVRGHDGWRRLRCGSCGADWPGRWLCCPFCGEQEEERLGSLLSTETAARHSVEVCDGCGGYIKGIVTATPMSGADVVLYDLTTPELDTAAADRGHRRPVGKGHELAVSVVRRPSRLRRLFGFSA